MSDTRSLRELVEAVGAGINPNELEAAIDRSSLSQVVDELADICGDKSEHLSSNWQDENTAKVWERAGTLLRKVARKVDEIFG